MKNTVLNGLMEFGLSSNPDKSILKLDPRTKLCLLTAISLIMVGGKTVGVEYILRIICAAIPFVLLLTVRHRIQECNICIQLDRCRRQGDRTRQYQRS